jgi:small subunit ribosomal protein S8
MSQDIVADGLNQIMNAKQAEKQEIVLRRYSKVLINLLNIMKEKGYIDYNFNETEKILKINILRLNKCHAVKPRYYTSYKDIDKYLRRFLPSRNFGTLIISTNKGLMTHPDAIANKIGGSLIAYIF